MPDYERDVFSVKETDGKKVIRYSGFTWPNEYGGEFDDGVPDYLADYMTCFVPVAEYTKQRLDDEMVAAQQYRYPLYTERDVLDYLRGSKHLALRDVSEDTPCGEYWCYFEEE